MVSDNRTTGCSSLLRRGAFWLIASKVIGCDAGGRAGPQRKWHFLGEVNGVCQKPRNSKHCCKPWVGVSTSVQLFPALMSLRARAKKPQLRTTVTRDITRQATWRKTTFSPFLACTTAATNQRMERGAAAFTTGRLCIPGGQLALVTSDV